MAISRWDPFGTTELRRRIDRLFDQVLPGIRGVGVEARPWAPPVEIIETGDEVIVNVEVPGMCQEDIEVELTGDTLSVSGERKMGDTTDKRQEWHVLERPYGPFSRSFTFAVPIDQNNVSASYENGVLCIRAPKAEEAKPRQIRIEVE